MKKNNIVLVLMVGIFFSCAGSKETTTEKKDNVFTYWVDSSTVACTGVAPMRCLRVKKGELFEDLEWTYFYSPIKGFDYKPGFLYKLQVREEKIPLDQVPADASSIRYTLVKILEKTPQKGIQLNDIWVLEMLGDIEIPASKGRNRTPQIEINLAENRFFGNDGCNNIMGGLKLVDAEKLEFGMIAGTKMACLNMQNSYKYTQALGKTKTYKIEGLKLYFFDAGGKELLQFKKVD